MAITTAELDPQFVKGLRLLFSKSKDASDQLKQMLDDVLTQRQSSDSREIQKESDCKVTLAKISLLKTETLSQGKQLEAKKKDVEKRPLEKTKTEIESSSEVTKKAKYESQKSSGNETTFSSSNKDDNETDNDDQVTDADDFAMEMGLACVVCRSLDVQPGNQLVECQECHNLYHQECHRPPATDQDVNDPRLVWYCTRCTKNLKKLATKSQKSKAGVPSSTKEISLSKISKPETPTLQPFKRAEPKSTVLSSSSSTSTQPLTGLASLAANLSGKVLSLNSKSSGNSKSSLKSSSSNISSGKSSLQLNISFNLPSFSKSQSLSGGLLSSLSSTSATGKTSSGNNSNNNSNNGSSSSSTSSNSNNSSSSKTSLLSSNSSNSKHASNSSNSNSSLMSADKRLQMMKKKAAAKMQEKRRLSK